MSGGGKGMAVVSGFIGGWVVSGVISTGLKEAIGKEFSKNCTWREV